MSRSATSIFVWGLYVIGAGLGFTFMPNMLLPLFGLPATGEVWVRFAGLLALFMGSYYLISARYNLLPIFKASLPLRILFAMSVFLLFFLGYSGPGLAVFSVIELLGAMWTGWALNSDAADTLDASQPAIH
jgi:hypothetical protein